MTRLGRLHVKLAAGVSCFALASCASVDIRNETNSVARSPADTYSLHAYVTKQGTIYDLTMTAIATSNSPVTYSGMSSSDGANFFGDAPSNPCNQVLSVQYEAKYRTQPAGSFKSKKSPGVGAHQIPIDGAPPASCGATGGANHVFKVNSTVDVVDSNPGDGVCSTGAVTTNGLPICTLRAAVMEANALAGVDLIEVPAGVYTLTIPDVGPASESEANAAVGDLDITEGVTIIGTTTNAYLGSGSSEQTVIKPTAIVDGNHANRVFDLHTAHPDFATTPDAGWTPDRIVELQKLTIRNGKLGLEHSGAGVLNRGFLRLKQVVFDSNQVNSLNNSSTVSDAPGGALANFGVVEGSELYFLRNVASDGGAFLNRGTATLSMSGFFFNTARGGGHAIENEGGTANLTLENVSFGKNGYFALPQPPAGTTPIGGGGDGGFAIVNSGGSILMRWVTLFSNKGGFWNSSGSINMTATLSGGNAFMNCAGTIAGAGVGSMIAPNPSYGYGPCSLSTTAFTPPSTVQLAKGVSPVFYTPKTAPWRNLVALALCPTRDQRNNSRTPVISSSPQQCDSGAVEYEEDLDSTRIMTAASVNY